MDLAKIGLAVESKGLKEGIRNLRQLEGEGARTERGMSKLKGTVAAVSAAFAALGAQQFASGVLDEARKLDTNLRRTKQLIETTGRSAETSGKAMHDQARELALATLESTEGIMEAQQILMSFRDVGTDSFEEVTGLALDLATVTKSDLSSSMTQLAKALQDPVKGINAMTRSGVSFSESQQEVIKSLVETGRQAEAQRLILDNIAGQYGGVAKEEALGFAGTQDTLGQKVQEAKIELAEQIGLLDRTSSAYNTMIGLTVSITDNMDKVIQVTQALTVLIGSRLAAALATATAAKIAATQQAMAYQAALARMAGASVAATTAVGALRGALTLLGGPVGLLIGAGGLLYVFREELGLADIALSNVEKSAKDTDTAIENLGAAVDASSEAALDANYSELTAQLFEVGRSAAQARVQLAELEAEQNNRRTEQSNGRGRRSIGPSGPEQRIVDQAAVRDAREELKRYEAQENKLVAAMSRNDEEREKAAARREEREKVRREGIRQATDAQDENNTSTREATKLTKTLAEETDEYANSLQPLLDRLYPVEAASRQYRNEQEALTVALARGEIGVVRYLDALNRLEEAQRSEQTPSGAYSGVGFGSQISSDEQGPGMGEQDPFAQWLEQANQAFTSFDQLQADTAQSFQTSFAQAFEQVLMGTKSADEAFKEMGRTILSTVVTAIGEMIAQWLVAQAVQAMLGEQGSKASEKQSRETGTKIAANYAPAAAAASLASFGTNAFPAIAGIVATNAVSAGFAGMFDEGGRIGGGQWGIAGEYGPEIIKGPAQVTSRKDTAAMMGSGDVTVNVNNAPPGTQVKERSVNGNQVIDVLVADLSQNGRASQAMQSTFGMNRRGR